MNEDGREFEESVSIASSTTGHERRGRRPTSSIRKAKRDSLRSEQICVCLYGRMASHDGHIFSESNKHSQRQHRPRHELRHHFKLERRLAVCELRSQAAKHWSLDPSKVTLYDLQGRAVSDSTLTSYLASRFEGRRKLLLIPDGAVIDTHDPTLPEDECYALQQLHEDRMRQVKTIPDDVRENLVPVAIANYASFHGYDPGDVRLEDVMYSSAGIDGWAESDFSELVVQCFLLPERVEDAAMVSCTKLNGTVITTIPVSPKVLAVDFQKALSQCVHIEPWRLRCVLPNGLLLEPVYESVPLLELLEENTETKINAV